MPWSTNYPPPALATMQAANSTGFGVSTGLGPLLPSASSQLCLLGHVHLSIPLLKEESLCDRHCSSFKCPWAMVLWGVNWGYDSTSLSKWEIIRKAVSSTCDHSMLSTTTYQEDGSHTYDCFCRGHSAPGSTAITIWKRKTITISGWWWQMYIAPHSAPSWNFTKTAINKRSF